MNRPRNRQPRPSRQNQQGGLKHDSGGRGPGTPQQAAGTVPNSTQVVPGAAVFIVLKEDQPTGRETQGIVKDVLTSGDHPRGIKVRLRDGQVGRVQRLDDGSSASPQGNTSAFFSNSRFSGRYTDVRNEEADYPQEPPPRSLADFIPNLDEPEDVVNAQGDPGSWNGDTSTVICPICEAFEGDESAVTHHIDKEHLS